MTAHAPQYELGSSPNVVFSPSLCAAFWTAYLASLGWAALEGDPTDSANHRPVLGRLLLPQPAVVCLGEELSLTRLRTGTRVPGTRLVARPTDFALQKIHAPRVTAGVTTPAEGNEVIEGIVPLSASFALAPAVMNAKNSFVRPWPLAGVSVSLKHCPSLNPPGVPPPLVCSTRPVPVALCVEVGVGDVEVRCGDLRFPPVGLRPSLEGGANVGA